MKKVKRWCVGKDKHYQTESTPGIRMSGDLPENKICLLSDSRRTRWWEVL